MVSPVSEHIDRLLSESPIGLSAAAKLFGSFRGGQPTSPATLYRWCTQGIRLRDGTRVHLEHIRIGARLMTSRPACIRFVEAQQSEPTAASSPPKSPRPSTRQRRAAAAGRKLADLGA
jgi:hypothetical protein